MTARIDARTSPTAPLDELAALRRKWCAALTPGAGLPPIDEVVGSGTGGIADDLVVFAECGSTGYQIVRAGRRIEEWIGRAADGLRLDELPTDCTVALRDAIAQARASGSTAAAVAHRVRDGMVETCDVLALPLADRSGRSLVAAYVREKGERYNLVDAIFRSADAGILAFAAVRDEAGAAVDFEIVALNEGACRLLQTSERELRWRKISELRLDARSANVRERLFATMATGRPDQFELDIPDDRGDVHLKVGVASIGDLLAATLTDIGDVKAREASFRLMFDDNPVPMYLFDPDTLAFLGVNDAAIEHYGYGREKFLAMNLRDIRPRGDRERPSEAAPSPGSPRQSDRTFRHLKADGSEIEVLAHARHIVYGKRPAVLVAIVDVTAHRQAEARIAHMAHHDALTDFPNRVRFNAYLGDALARVRRQGETLAVLCLDLDRFKDVNDTLGHAIGDQLLKAVAARLLPCVRETDLVARLGGDEFAIVQAGIGGPNGASALASRLTEVLAAPYEVEGHAVVTGACIGIALAPGDGTSAEVLLRNADIALHRAKAAGRGAFRFFEPEMDRAVRARRTLELDLRKAYQEGEFELHYQPLVDLKRGEVSGFEALLRWRHPQRGMVMPADFIRLAEEIGLIVPLGEWVIRQACAEAASWPSGVKIAVNLSPVQFKRKNLLQAVVGALDMSRLPANRLELEITEFVLLSENEANLAMLHQLRELGVRISMDDFGTGYSSLSYLRSFPFDKIKIDKSFVGDADRPDCMAIIRAVAGLGASLGIATTAEGVETAEQLERLRQEGCTEVQGYLLSPPRPASEVAELLKRGRNLVGKAAA